YLSYGSPFYWRYVMLRPAEPLLDHRANLNSHCVLCILGTLHAESRSFGLHSGLGCVHDCVEATTTYSERFTELLDIVIPIAFLARQIRIGSLSKAQRHIVCTPVQEGPSLVYLCKNDPPELFRNWHFRNIGNNGQQFR